MAELISQLGFQLFLSGSMVVEAETSPDRISFIGRGFVEVKGVC